MFAGKAVEQAFVPGFAIAVTVARHLIESFANAGGEGICNESRSVVSKALSVERWFQWFGGRVLMEGKRALGFWSLKWSPICKEAKGITLIGNSQQSRRIL